MTTQENLKTKSDIASWLEEIEQSLEVDDNSPSLHALTALNQILSQQNAEEILDNANKSRAIKIWNKLKETGLLLDEPPLLFGYPELENQ